jgi:hypothetical protein
MGLFERPRDHFVFLSGALQALRMSTPFARHARRSIIAKFRRFELQP